MIQHLSSLNMYLWVAQIKTFSSMINTHAHTHARTINDPHLPYKTGLDITQSYPLHRTRFGQYQASSAVLGWPGDRNCYIMHRMQSGGWSYSKVSRDSSKAPSLRAAVLCAAVFRSKILHSNRIQWSSRVTGAYTCTCLRTHTEVLEIPEVLMAINA